MSTTSTPTFRKQCYSRIDLTTFDTPLVRLNRTAPDADISIKLEFFNPMSSVKDRIGRAMIEAGEKDGVINADTHIIEPTSGNTGIALAFICAARGYKLTLTMPESMSLERRAILKALGANLVLTPADGGMKGAIDAASELAGQSDNTFIPGQFDNPANPQVHYATTGPEIWADTQGDIDIFVAGVGTGGTVSGAGKFLKEQNPDIKVFAVEPVDSPVISGGQPGKHKIQGIGAGFIPNNLDTDILDGVETVSNEEAFAASRLAAQHDGILGGISTGGNIQAALNLARKFPGKRIVTVAPSFGERYLSTPLFDI